MNRILCSTGAVIGRPNGRDITLLKNLVNVLECDGFEFMMYDSFYEKVDQITDFMVSLNVSVPSFHCEKQIGELIGKDGGGDFEKALECFDINCRMAENMGCEKLVLHLWNGVFSDANIKRNIEAYKDLKAVADKYRLDLTVENVVCTYEDPMTHFESLASCYPDAHFTYDTKMAHFHRQLELLYTGDCEWIKKHIRHIHVNDHKGGYKDWSNLRTLRVGEGEIDFDTFFRFVKSCDYSGDYTVEGTSFGSDGVIDIDGLNRCFERVRKLI